MRTEKFVRQARLPNPRFADDRYYLAVPEVGKLLRAQQLLELHVAADKACQAAPGSGLEARSRCTLARHLVDLYWIGEPLYRHGTE